MRPGVGRTRSPCPGGIIMNPPADSPTTSRPKEPRFQCRRVRNRVINGHGQQMCRKGKQDSLGTEARKRMRQRRWLIILYFFLFSLDIANRSLAEIRGMLKLNRIRASKRQILL